MAAGSVLPDEMLPEVQAEIEIFQRKLKAQDTFELRLVEAAAIAQVKLNRLNLVLEKRTIANVRHALVRWDEAREAEVRELTELLEADPTLALEGLNRITEGCDRLADLWQSLGDALGRAGRWDDDEARLFLNLMGFTRPPRADQHPEAYRAYTHAYALYALADPAKHAAKLGSTVEAVTRGLPTREQSLAALAEHIAAEIAALEARAADLWERFDRPDRESAPDLALFDPSPEAKLLYRYIADAERSRRRALVELAALRADAAKVRREADAPIPPTPRAEPARSKPEPAEAPTSGNPVPARSEPEPSARPSSDRPLDPPARPASDGQAPPEPAG